MSHLRLFATTALLSLTLTACSTSTPTGGQVGASGVTASSPPTATARPGEAPTCTGTGSCTTPLPSSAPSTAIPTDQPSSLPPTTVTTSALAFSKISTLAGTKEQVDKDGSLAEARFYSPTGIVADGAGNIYIADEGTHVIRKIATDGTVTTLAGKTGMPGYKDGSAKEAQFRNPWDLVLDEQGNLYVADSGNHRIRKIAPDGTVSTLAGSGKNAFNNGSAMEASFFSPNGLTRDSQGNLYVSDSTNNAIRKISPDGTVSTLAGAADGTSGLADGKGSAALFRRPGDVLSTAQGLYVADDGNNAIRLIAADGTVTTLAGNGVRAQGATDGLGKDALLNGPVSLTVDKAGNIYFVEFNGNTVRQMTPAGQVTTLIKGIPGGATDGPLSEGKVYAPTGIFFDGKALLIADRDNHRVRKIE